MVNDILAILKGDALVKNTRIINYDETPSGRLEAKIRCQLPKGYLLQVWIHLEPDSLDYAYQLFTTVPLLRWDNSPHYGNLHSAPHHFHDGNGNVHASPLTGNVSQDLEFVLDEIHRWMKN
jgi:hypothetical protein